MNIKNNKEPLILFLGDLFFLYVALFLMLIFSYSGLPSGQLLSQHIGAFTFIFIIWLLVFFVAGLYEKHTLLFKNKLPNTILNAQLTNIAIAILFFYLLPVFGITPKTNLFIYLILSFALMLSWRIYGYPAIGFGKKEKALIIGGGKETKELVYEVNNNSRYNFFFVSTVDLSKKKEALNIFEQIKQNDIKFVVADFESGQISFLLPKLYKLIYSKVEFFDKHKVYEEIFDKIPLSLLGYNWFLENISLSPKPAFDFFKRILDIFVALFLGVATILLFPLVVLAVKFESPGRAFIVQKRVGQNSKFFKVYKFRTMERNDSGESVKKTKEKNKVTKVGAFLRKTRIDELPQLYNVLKGDLSLIGPRPELPSLADVYTRELPYYNVRHLVKPGLSGWAQLCQEAPPKFETRKDDTKTKLSYDLYYIKNRSIMLELKIALRTIKTLLSRSGV
ncbi:hypothetical protein COV42_00090 [Candidatus Campbellbacteria bacterium CG11_big_fil_rev_8_21_14_0_20_44_21]|uniref:Bacterial sugar transferase domain-containing protein n=1 Tax=Candidatus Campbellbacteria bacterium CG22_combo_CG10-13_8_21_14_all_43_18 TaxID=1974530 RepID=A0A2H0DVS7_9BACT|nr:MAG: hypothetical protein COW82_02820 [Candidatus Campbellbacteria bacterium CG22_combo_CG10-13_8_21_14_all_43_18]PIR24568.1 MAG: hypothetical protein COV42_00090 [Candidatus Campbellbacteria bacterium CG11_big_fil_rev_8_21_14_0_20_44_21]